MDRPDTLNFTFAPHVLEDLGVNLYTSVAKALVEFVANAYDADADSVEIKFNQNAIDQALEHEKTNFRREKKDAAQAAEAAKRVGNTAEYDKAMARLEAIKPLDERALPDSITVEVHDTGSGMSRDDLQDKFLVVGRRRRKGQEKVRTAEKARPIMGRKGLGKLAGFGIARRIEVITRVAGESHATRIVLDLDKLLASPSPASTAGKPAAPSAPSAASNAEAASPGASAPEITPNEPAAGSDTPISVDHSVPVVAERLEDGGGIATRGTRIILNRLVYEGVKGSVVHNLSHSLAENFFGISPKDFKITINTSIDVVAVETMKGNYAYAHPPVEGVGVDELVTHTIEGNEFLPSIPFSYRFRFRGEKGQLPAKQRGVRVYAHHRLASVPDLLDLSTNTHGFKYTSYLEGVVVADFLDELSTDYISTDRQTLRWETPLLSRLRQFLTDEMSRAVGRYADLLAEKLEDELKNHQFTQDAINSGHLPKHREKTAWQIAKVLAGKDPNVLDSEFYQSVLPNVISGLGSGQIISSLYELAKADTPDLPSVIAEITRLTKLEFDDFLSIVHGRLKAIEALAKIADQVDFRAPKNEKPLHSLFKNNAWLLDPTFFEFLSSEVTEKELSGRLAKHLEIDVHAPATMDQAKRPDLTFLIGNGSLKRFVIIEFKAPNLPLDSDHLDQLTDYMGDAREWLKLNVGEGFRVEGILVGSKELTKQGEKVVRLKRRIAEDMHPTTPWQVLDILEVLDRTRAAHRELLEVYRRAGGASAGAP
ncbi:MAG: ATP-binding protein [Verrucomicrobia bacterium]|nr:ATP-binding protein [Verrucomicrobiota bacterium]